MKINLHLLLLICSLIVSNCISEEKKEEEAGGWSMRGWLKMLSEKGGDEASLPSKFLINTGFSHQEYINPQEDLVSSDEFGFLNIPDQVHFYMMMNSHTLYMVNGRRNDLAQTHLSISFKELVDRNTNEQDQDIGGIQDIGNFKEGYCFRLLSKQSIEYTFCADTMLEKSRWMDKIRPQIKEGVTNDLGIKGSVEGSAAIKESDNMLELPRGFAYGVSGDSGAPKMYKDGSWVTLQDYTECTLACGGGTSYLHRMCVPPENGGLPCQGPSILSKSCNTSPCPVSDFGDQPPPPKLLDPIIRVMPISNRLQRYEICVIKEGDMLLQMSVDGNKMELPVRVILNNRTISLFSQSSYNNIYKSFELPFLQIDMVAKSDKKRCFSIADNRVTASNPKQEVLCIMPQALRKGQSQEGAKNQWMKDILVFRDQCGAKVEYSDQGQSSEFLKGMNNDLSSDIMDMALMDQDVDKVQKKGSNIDQTSQNAASAIDSEIKFQRLKREELQDLEELMSMELKKEVETETKQEKDCVKNEMKAEKKEIIKKMETEKADMENEFKATEQATILKTRGKANFQMEKDKIIAARKLKAQKERLFVIKEKIGKEVVDESRKGDSSKCDPKTVPAKDQTSFCESKYSLRPYIYVDCIKKPINFCMACCEYQFGALQQEGREECYKVCLDFTNDSSSSSSSNSNKGFVQLNTKATKRMLKKALNKQKDSGHQ